MAAAVTDRAPGLFLMDYFHPVPRKRKWYRKPELKGETMKLYKVLDKDGTPLPGQED